MKILIAATCLAAPVLFVAMLVWLVRLMGSSEWRTLAKLYPAAQRPVGSTFRFRNLEIAYSSSYSLVTFVVSETGLYISSWGPFRIGHPSMLIPWSAIEDLTANSFTLETWVRITPPTITLRITPIVLNAARQYLPAKIDA